MVNIPKVVLLIESSREFGRELLTGISQYSRFHGPWSFFTQQPFFRTDLFGERKTLNLIKNWNPTGIITRETGHIDEIIALGLPTVIAGTTKKLIPDYPIIATDNLSVGTMAAEHLLERGFRYFAYCGFDEQRWSRERCESFCKRIIEAGFSTKLYQQPKSQKKRAWDIEQTIIADWIKALPKPIGLMACTDERSQQVIEACKLVDISVPEQVAVIGVDNDNLVCNLANPQLSSVALAVEKAGYEAAELLDNLMSGKEKMAGQRIIVRPMYIEIRRSTDIMAIMDPDVVHAMKFIREHCRDIIQVDDVVEDVAVSRRALERRFRKVLGRSILEEIRHIRVEQIVQMLVKTNLSISKIASKLGYTGVAHISRYFQKEKGMSLLSYRKQHGLL